MKKTTLFMILALVLSLAVGLTGTLAYLTDTDADVNVMTLGNVNIEQHEYERVPDGNGDYEKVTSEKYGEGYKLQEFTQGKPLYPAVGTVTGWGTGVYFDQLDDGASGGQYVLDGLNNVQDKFVLVENTGKSDAYVRTIIAYEQGDLSFEDWNRLVMTSVGTTSDGQNWKITDVGETMIDECKYFLIEYLYIGNSTRHTNGLLPAGEWTYNSLGQIYLKPEATNEDCEALDGNDNGTYDILVVSQAVQAQGFSDAQTALDEAFGDITTTNHPWLGVEPNDAPTKLNVVNNPDDTLNSLLNGEDIYAEEGTDDELIIETDEAITLDADGAKVVLNGSAREGEEKTYAYLGFVPPAGEDISISNLNVSGTGFVELGHYGVGGGDYVANNLQIKDLASTLAIGNNGNTLAPAFSHYGNAVLNNCVMKGTTADDASATAYDAIFSNKTVTNINGGEYGKIYVYEHAKVTIKDAKVDQIDSYAMVKNGWGQLVIGDGAVVDTINLNMVNGTYEATLTIEPGATVGQINYNGETFTQAEWMAR